MKSFFVYDISSSVLLVFKYRANSKQLTNYNFKTALWGGIKGK